MDGLTPEARLLLAGIIIVTVAVAFWQATAILNDWLDDRERRRDARRRNQAHRP
jgi:hypothetical protein